MTTLSFLVSSMEVSPKYPWNIPKISPENPQNIPGISPKYPKKYPENISGISPRYPENIPKISSAWLLWWPLSLFLSQVWSPRLPTLPSYIWNVDHFKLQVAELTFFLQFSLFWIAKSCRTAGGRTVFSSIFFLLSSEYLELANFLSWGSPRLSDRHLLKVAKLTFEFVLSQIVVLSSLKALLPFYGFISLQNSRARIICEYLRFLHKRIFLLILPTFVPLFGSFFSSVHCA